MSDSVFLDTNILVYAYDNSEPEKRDISQEILENGLRNENIILSTQVFGECFNVVTRNIQHPFSIMEAEEILRTFKTVPVVDITLPAVWRAIDIHKSYQTSYWDSLIIATAELAGCKTIYSEEFNHSQKYNNIRVINPFKSP